MRGEQVGVGEDLVDRAVGDDDTAVHHDRPLAQLGRIGQVVGDDQHRGLQPGQRLGQLPARDRVEIGRRFVENENVGLAGQHGGQRGAPALPGGQMRRAAVGVVGQRHRVQRPGHAGGQRVTAHTEIGRAERDVLRDGRHEQLVVGVLEHQPDPSADVLNRLAVQRDTADLDRTGRGGEHTVEVQHQRGLTRAVGAQDGDPLAGCDGEVDMVERDLPVGVDVAQRLDVDRRHRVTHASTETATAAYAGISATAHCAAAARGGAPMTARSGALPSNPRDSIATYTRSPRS